VYPCQDPLLYTIASEYRSRCTGEAYVVLFLTISGSHCLTESIIQKQILVLKFGNICNELIDTLEVHLLQHQCLSERWMGTPTLKLTINVNVKLCICDFVPVFVLCTE
jgi:hypothetical protein